MEKPRARLPDESVQLHQHRPTVRYYRGGFKRGNDRQHPERARHVLRHIPLQERIAASVAQRAQHDGRNARESGAGIHPKLRRLLRGHVRAGRRRPALGQHHGEENRPAVPHRLWPHPGAL
uniref:(northern house mosquito) hypothetical protein n=1 Tax=Culex pipiens TaxID=7175 RepID=A0A8D8DUA8_CULPI